MKLNTKDYEEKMKKASPRWKRPWVPSVPAVPTPVCFPA